MKVFSKFIDLRKHVFLKNSDEDKPNQIQVYDSQVLPVETNQMDQSSTSAEIVNSDQSNELVNSNQSNELALSSNGGDLVEWSPAMQSLLEEPPSTLPIQMITGGIVFCLVCLAWAWFGEIEKIGKAHGKLIPYGETYKIESLESAKIANIAVEDGDVINRGQLIASLDSEQEEKEVKRQSEILAANEVELEQKLQLLEKVKIEADTQQLVAQSEIRSKEIAIESATAKTQVIQNLLAQKQSEIQAYVNRQKQGNQLSELDQAKLTQINSDLEEHQKRLKRLESLAQQGAISQEFVFQAQQTKRQIEQQVIDSKLQGIGNVNQQIFQLNQSLRDMQTNITENKGELTVAKKELDLLQSELAQTKAEARQTELGAQQKIQQLELEINQARTQIAETKNQLAIANSRLAKRQLRSPVAGTVLASNVVNPGKVVQSGETVAEVAASDSSLVLSASIPDRDAGFIEKGMAAQIKFDAYSYQDFGTIPGEVISISSNTKTDESLGEVYRVKIELEQDHIVDESKKVLFKPGQTATADIVIRRQRIIDVLLEPIKKIQRDGINL